MAAAFVVDNRLALLALPDRSALADVPVPDGVALRGPTSGAQLRTLAALRNGAWRCRSQSR